MEKALVLNAVDFGVEESKAKQIEAVFVPMVAMLKAMEGEYNALIKKTEGGVTDEIVDEAKVLLNKMARVRIDTEAERKKEKEVYLVGGKAVDGISNILKHAVVGKEKNLKEIINHAEMIEGEKRVKLLLDRKKKLAPFEVENLDSIDLSGMAEEVFNNFLIGAQTNFNTKKAAEEKVEKDRIEKEKAEKEEQERIKKENDKLKREAEEREEKEKAEKEAREKELEKERAEAKKKQDEVEAKARAEKEARERLEAEAKEKQEAELREKLEKEVEEKKKLEEKEKAEKNDKYKVFLKKNNYDPNVMRIQQDNNTFTIWKKLDTITI